MNIKLLFKLLMFSLVAIPISLSFSACSEGNLLNFEGISFESLTCEYDGEEHSVEISGDLPEGVAISYSNNKATNAGTYNAQATVSLTGYKTITLTATLKINKASYDMSNAKWNYQNAFSYDGNEKQVLVTGLPKGVTVAEYRNNNKTNVGQYTASAILNYDKANYNAVSIEDCNWEIVPDLSTLALSILNNLMKVPDPWAFLPESFALENKAYNANTDMDFSSFINVSSLPKTGFGKQMNVVYSTLLDADTALSYLRYIYGSFNVIVNLYQNFINSNPDNYASYEKQTDNFTFKILLNNSDYKMFISYKSVAMELSYELQTKKCSGRIQLSNSNVIKYEMSNDELTIASNIVGLSVTQLHFEREDEIVSGYLYEYYGTETKNIKTSALIKVDENYTSIISNKRETDDLSIEGCMEIYKNTTGNLVGMEIKETVKNIKYETSWFNLWNISNINSIKVLDDTNGLNADTIYINNSDNPIKTKLVGGLSSKSLSRRFDIEMKDLYAYKFNEETEKYEKIKIEIPMMFIQNEFISSFANDFYSANSSTGAINPTQISMLSADYNYMISEYAQLIDEYLIIKNQTTRESIINYIGTKDQYFE